jgi:hypothetical protein
MPTRRAFLAATGLAAAVSLDAQSFLVAGDIRTVVALDGSGDFPTIQRAVDHILDHAPRNVSRAILEIRPGVYRERVKIPRDKLNFTFAGADAASTTISANVSAAAAGGTFFSPVVEVNGDGFEAHDIAFENTFGVGSQAVALSIHAFRNCRFAGWQDTLYAAWGRQYYRDCYIEGHVDFILGDAAAVFGTLPDPQPRQRIHRCGNPNHARRAHRSHLPPVPAYRRTRTAQIQPADRRQRGAIPAEGLGERCLSRPPLARLRPHGLYRLLDGRTYSSRRLG